MRHRKRGRRLGRSSSHRKAMLKNLASSLFLTERDSEFDDNAPKIKGRVVTTLHKAKEVRPLVEKCITIARRSLAAEEAAKQYETSETRGSEAWKSWRQSEQWQKWCNARAPVVAARRRTLQLLGDKQAVQVLFEEVAPRFADRPGGYTRILRLAGHRIGDAGIQAILEFVGKNDRKTVKSAKPSFADTSDSDDAVESDEADDEVVAEASDETVDAEAESNDESANDDAADGDSDAEDKK